MQKKMHRQVDTDAPFLPQSRWAGVCGTSMACTQLDDNSIEYISVSDAAARLRVKITFVDRAPCVGSCKIYAADALFMETIHQLPA
ncbi:hypothetical protein EVAR_60941_1 [Eumeta japonica]|uniref:Uncharacterized protein n=1 Tax=Eumeta variegata TaxID=151549 RepID=A0A4C1ZGA1_EUMVA|nr:hypothetical protein EVAR_60941_1 [Eumeta japonica]